MPVVKVEPIKRLVDDSLAYLDADLHAKMSARLTRAERLAAVVAPIRALVHQDEGAVRALELLAESHRDARQRTTPSASGTRRTVLPFATAGMSLLVPPYDAEWSFQPPGLPPNVAAYAGKDRGIFGVAADSAGRAYVAAGIAVFLGSSTFTDVRFSADAEYTYYWHDHVHEGEFASVDGGVGVLVYRDGDSRPVIDRRVSVFHDERLFPSPDGEGEGDVFLTSTPAGEEFFELEAGSTCVVWVWCWASNVQTSPAQSAGQAKIDCKVPFVVVDVS